MSFPITFQFAVPPEGTCPTTFTEAVATLQTLLTAEVTTTYAPVVFGSETPTVDDQDKPWIRTNSFGAPTGTYVFYGGSWRREIGGVPGQITAFNGNPATYFDGTGIGIVGGFWDGWRICNGLNGTPNLTDKFIVAAHMDNSAGQNGYTGGVWKTMVSGTILQTGGTATTTLSTAQIPRVAEAALILDTFQADGNARDDSGSLYGVHSVATTSTGYDTVVAADAGNTSPTPFSNLPPYYALAYVIFVGYL